MFTVLHLAMINDGYYKSSKKIEYTDNDLFTGMYNHILGENIAEISKHLSLSSVLAFVCVNKNNYNVLRVQYCHMVDLLRLWYDCSAGRDLSSDDLVFAKHLGIIAKMPKTALNVCNVTLARYVCKARGYERFIKITDLEDRISGAAAITTIPSNYQVSDITYINNNNEWPRIVDIPCSEEGILLVDADGAGLIAEISHIPSVLIPKYRNKTQIFVLVFRKTHYSYIEPFSKLDHKIKPDSPKYVELVKQILVNNNIQGSELFSAAVNNDRYESDLLARLTTS
jgi:hypothetical protein